MNDWMSSAQCIEELFWRSSRGTDLNSLLADVGAPGVAVRATDNVSLLRALTELADEEIRMRLAHGHRPYVAWLNEHPVAYGWVACEQASVGELGRTLRLDARTRYLWGFVTLPE
jgi:hypothetical protein